MKRLRKTSLIANPLTTIIKSVLDPIIKLQKRGGRMLIGAPRLTPTEHVSKELKWTDISTRW